MNRRSITQREIKEHIRRLEKLGVDRETISLLRATLEGMKNGTVKIFQRVPKRKD